MKRRTTRADISGFGTVYSDLWRQLRETATSLWQLAVYLVLLPVHHLLWLWLPQMSEQLREQRAEQAREWADADF